MTRMRIGSKDIRDADVFQILLENFPDIIHSVDPDGRIVFTNAKAEALLGYSLDELIGMDVRKLYSEEILRAVEAGFSDLKATGDKEGIESVLVARDGTEIPVEIRSFSLYDDDGNFIRTFSILRDIRAIKELQESLVHAGRLAAIGELASGVAHDINNPLTVILLSNELLVRQIGKVFDADDEVGGRLRKMAADVERASRSIEKLVNHLRNFSRGVAEKQEIVDLWETINDAQFIARNKVLSAGITLIDETEKGIYFTTGRPNQLEQVFMNLISNACDAMAGRDKRDLTIAIKPDERGATPCWRCDVSDTGCGIPARIRKEIFESFFTTKEKGKGTGLGLSISSGIVNDHGGEMDVTSEEGAGTTFHVYLPRTDARG